MPDMEARNHLRGHRRRSRKSQAEGDISPIHDPHHSRGNTYYVFALTGSQGNSSLSSASGPAPLDVCGHVFDAVPEWALKECRCPRHLAPDISTFHGQYL